MAYKFVGGDGAMSCWTEYVVADVADAEMVANVTVPRDRWAGFEGFKGFGAPHHTALSLVLGCAAVESDFSELTFGDAGMVAELPPDFLRAIRSVTDGQMPEVASQWALRLGAMREQAWAEELTGLLRQLQALARRAEESGQSILFWQGFG
jgi:hypothetical protein